MKKRTKRASIAAALVFYLSSYVCARYTHLLIHRVSYSGESRFHTITQGDFIGLSSNALPAALSYWIFLPLRLAEGFAWNTLPHPAAWCKKL
jgi:hypothetical protein